HLRFAHQRAADLDAPLHACAVRTDQLVAEACIEPDRVENSLHLSVRLRQTAYARKVAEILARGPRRLALARFIADEADHPAHGQRLPLYVVPPQPGPSLSRRQQRRQHANRRGLAGAVETEKPVQLPFWNPQRDTIDGHERSEAPR